MPFSDKQQEFFSERKPPMEYQGGGLHVQERPIWTIM